MDVNNVMYVLGQKKQNKEQREAIEYILDLLAPNFTFSMDKLPRGSNASAMKYCHG